MSAAESTTACMHDRSGHRVERWVPAMQSRAFLRQSIARGERTAECWAELTTRTERVRAGQAVIAAMKAGQFNG